MAARDPIPDDLAPRDASSHDRARVEGDKRFTGQRRESKYFVAAERADAMVKALDEMLPRHEFRGALAGLSDSGDEAAALALLGDQGGLVQHFISTLYFDTEDCELFRENLEGAEGTKIRVREYYDLHPALTELATTPDEAVSVSRTRWLELKHRDSDRTLKTRLGVSRAALGQLLQAGELSLASVDARLAEIAGPTQSPEGAEGRDETKTILRDLRQILQRLAGPLRGAVMVHYQRRAWQALEHGLRVTIDGHLIAADPAVALAYDDGAWTRERLGPAFAQLDTPIVELKQLEGGSTEMIESLVRQFDLRPATLPPPQSTRRMSKFLWACGAKG